MADPLILIMPLSMPHAHTLSMDLVYDITISLLTGFVMAWLLRLGIRTYTFLTKLPTLLSQSVTLYLALYP